MAEPEANQAEEAVEAGPILQTVQPDDAPSTEATVEAEDTQDRVATSPNDGATEPQADQEAVEAQPKSLYGRFMAGISRNVLVLGAVSFFTDVSSEMIVPLRILFLVIALHTPLPIAGLIEGVAESTASILKIFSGRVADRATTRKPLIFFGYSASNLAKPLLALVGTWPAALGLIFIDRVGKGLRGSPRDALMADSTEPRYMGKAFGFHRSMDTLGAAVGPLLTYLILLVTNNDLRAVFGWTVVPGVLSVIVILFFLRQKRNKTDQPVAEKAPKKERASIRPSELSVRFWMFTAISTVFALGNSSDAFIFLRTADLESSLAVVPLIYFGYNFVYAFLATPLGALSDRLGRIPVLITGYAAFGLVYLGWAMATQAWNAWVLFLVYGIYAAATEGVAKAFVTDMVPKSARGSALGWFNGLTGMAALPANLVAGWLWSAFGPAITFSYGAWVSLISLGLLLAWLPWLRRSQKPAAQVTAPVTTQ